jgi:hypothetical protein
LYEEDKKRYVSEMAEYAFGNTNKDLNTDEIISMEVEQPNEDTDFEGAEGEIMR